MNPQLCSSSGRSRYSSSAFAQGSLNDLFLFGSRFTRQPHVAFRSSYIGRPRKPTLIDREILRVAHDYGSLDDVLQFANVTRPRVRLKQFQAPLVHPANALSRFPRVAIDEVSDQHRNIFPSFPQRRYLDRKNVEPIKEIAPKGARIDGRLQVTVGGGNDANIRPDGSSSTDTFEFMFLQNTQESDLGLSRNLSDFIEEDRPSFS